MAWVSVRLVTISVPVNNFPQNPASHSAPIMSASKFQPLKVFRLIAAASVLMMNSCATAFLRSEGTATPKQAFPATTFDGQWFWRLGIKGEPMMSSVNPKELKPSERTSPLWRLTCGVGGLIDLPFSVVSDTLLLPMDLLPRKRKGEAEAGELNSNRHNNE